MKKLFALIGARNKEFYRDRTALIWTLLFPFIVLAGFAYGYSGRQDPLLRVRVSPAASLSLPALRDLQEVPGVEVLATDDEPAALKRLERYELDLVVSAVADGGAPEQARADLAGHTERSPQEDGSSREVGERSRRTHHTDARRLVCSRNADSDKGLLAERLLRDAAARQAAPPTLEPRAVTGRRIRYADWLLPGLLAMNLMFGSMFGVGYVVVRYRKNGVLKRLRATPLSAFQFLTAQVVSRMLLMVVTSFMVMGGAMVLIGFRPQGSWLTLAAFICVCSAAMISLGLIVAARIATEEVAEGILNLMTWPMIFLSGIWFSLEGASDWVLWGARLMPLTHVVDGLRAILLEGAGLAQLAPQISVLLTLSVVFLGVGSAIFRWR